MPFEAFAFIPIGTYYFIDCIAAMTSIAAEFESENTSRCQKAGKENLRNIPKKVNGGNGDAKKLFKSPKPSSKISETAVEVQPEEKPSVVQGYARKERKRFGIDPNRI